MLSILIERSEERLGSTDEAFTQRRQAAKPQFASSSGPRSTPSQIYKNYKIFPFRAPSPGQQEKLRLCDFAALREIQHPSIFPHAQHPHRKV
jgi:hypothetical protein